MSNTVITMSNVGSMFLYLIVYIISALLLKRSRIMETKRIDLYFIFSILLPVILAAHRYYVGTDFENYIYIYMKMSRYRFITWLNREFGLEGTPFALWVIGRIAATFHSRNMFFGLLSLAIYLPTALAIKKRYPNEITFYATFAFLASSFTNGFNGIKQYAAISIIILALDFIYERKFWKYLLMLLLAACFHLTAIIAISIYFLWKPESVLVSFKRVFLIGCFVILLIFAPKILTMLGGRYANYADSVENISNKSFYLNFVWTIFFLIMRKKFVAYDFRNDLLITLVIISQILGVSGFYSPAVNRISLYFSFSRTFLLFQIPYVFHENDKFILKTLVFLYVTIMFIVNFYVYGFSDIIPYKFVGGF